MRFHRNIFDLDERYRSSGSSTELVSTNLMLLDFIRKKVIENNMVSLIFLILWIVQLLIILVMIFMAVNAYRKQAYKLPIIGEWAERKAMRLKDDVF